MVQVTKLFTLRRVFNHTARDFMAEANEFFITQRIFYLPEADCSKTLVD